MESQNQILRRRPLITGVPFFLPVTIPFTGVVNEKVTVYTNPAQNVGDLDVIGAVMNLESVEGQFTLDRQPLFSSENIMLAGLFGKPDGPKPIIYHHPPKRLSERQRIRADLLNMAGEGAGWMVFICRQVGVEGPMTQALLDYQGQGNRSTIVLDSLFAGTALNDIKRNTTPIINDDFIWKSSLTNLKGASVRISGIDGRSWMDEFVPLPALAGRPTSQIPNQAMDPVCFIPAGYAIGIEFKNEGVVGVAEASGKIELGGQRIPRQ